MVLEPDFSFAGTENLSSFAHEEGVKLGFTCELHTVRHLGVAK
jgi:hypothetical protein